MLITFEKLRNYNFGLATKSVMIENIDRYSETADSDLVYRELYEFEESRALSASHFDVFLSHSYQDAKIKKSTILQTKQWLQNAHKLSVYIDWLVDPKLPRAAVTPQTAKILKLRMKQSDCLFFVTSQNSSSSKWMPWELGFKDGDRNRHGHCNRCAVLPIVDQQSANFQGQEYLGMYPFVEEIGSTLYLSPQPKLSSSKSETYDDWCKNGRDPK